MIRLIFVLAALTCMVACDISGLPLIAVISAPSPDALENNPSTADKFWSVIAKSSVSYVEQAGAMPLLVPFDIPIATLNHVLNRVNGVHLIGGGAALFNKDGSPSFWLQRVNHILAKAKGYNDDGKYFPLLATSLGMESIVLAMSGNDSSVLRCGLKDLDTSHSVEKTEDFAKSLFWKKLDGKLVDKVLKSENLYFSHDCGFDPAQLGSHPAFKQEAVITGTSVSKNGEKLVAIVEHKKYPFIGL